MDEKRKKILESRIDYWVGDETCIGEPLPPEVAKALKDNNRRKHPHLYPKE